MAKLFSADLSPAHWGDDERERFARLQAQRYPPNPLAVGTHGAITGAHNALAIRAGLAALEQGGSSVDAALTAALAQITLTAGAPISFAGIMTLIHFDASSGETATLNACWNTVREEKEPLTIPGFTELSVSGLPESEVSGRTALVPGFMKGVEEAHRRFGRLAFAALFEPAVYWAENGFDVGEDLDWFIALRENDLRRLPETRAIFFKPDGARYRLGDRFRQPQLARTLRTIARDGAAYMYSGAWAEHAVAAIQHDGGKMTVEDLAAYEVIWDTPVEGTYGGRRLMTTRGPGLGGAHIIEALNLAEASDLTAPGHWSRSAESFRRLALVSNISIPLSYMPPDVRATLYPGLDLSLESRMNKETARKLWERMAAGVLPFHIATRPSHSDVVVAADRFGNLTALCQSINAVLWGKTAIMVDGVSIGDPAAHQQGMIAQTQPGGRLPDPTCVGLVADGERPFLAFGSMGAGLHQQTLQSLVNALSFGMNLKEAIDAPALLYPDPGNAERSMRLRVVKGSFDERLLAETGFDVIELGPDEIRLAQGIWVAVERAADGTCQAASPTFANGQAIAF